MRFSRSLFKLALLIVFLLSIPSQLKAQDVASVTGVITDKTGAVLPGAKITLVNPATGSTYEAISNSVGAYNINRVPPGPGYKVTISLNGFNSVVVSDVYLNVGAVRTQNAQLEVGAVTQAVEVSASGQNVTLDTTSAMVGNNFQVELVNELPVQMRDTPAALFRLQPGTTSSGAVTGARTDQNNVTLDGLDVNDMVTGSVFAVIGGAPVDAIQEFRGTTAGPGADAGQGGGGQFAMVTKSGTNKFHGSLFEYHRDTQLEANDWFNNNSRIGRAPLIRNQFGGNFAGPILRNKLFFFFEYNGRRDRMNTQASRTVPLDSFRNGNVSYIKGKSSAGTDCAATSRQNTTPSCIGALNSTALAAMDPKGIGFDSSLMKFINDRYPHANDLTGGDGINTGLFRFNSPVPLEGDTLISRLDYSINDKMSLFVRGNVVSQWSADSTNFAAPVQFAGDPVTRLATNASWAYVVGHSWQISPSKTNQFIYGETRSRLGFPSAYNPTGAILYSFGDDGTGSTILSDPYSGALNAETRITPIPVVRDDFTWLKGTHSLQMGGLFKFIKTYSNALLNFHEPTLGLGGNLTSLNQSLRPKDIRATGTVAAKTYDSAFALALGRFGSINSTYNYDANGNVRPQASGSERRYRYYETESYFADTWRVSPSFTLSYGVRYSWYSVPYEVDGRESVQNFTFDNYFNARVAQSRSGISGDSALPLIAYTLGGKANNAAGLYRPSYKNFAPRVSFAYSPSNAPKSVFNGGAGVIYDHTVISAVQYQQDQWSYLFQTSLNTSFGTSGDPIASLLNDPRFTSINSIPQLNAAPVITKPYKPNVAADGTLLGLANGRAFNTTIDPNLRNPYNIVYNLGFQHEFPQGFILKTSYVGRLGRRLLAQVDANQVVDFPDVKSSQMLSTAFANLTTELRNDKTYETVTAQPWFENVVQPGVGKARGRANNTSYLAYSHGSYIENGDFADFVQTLAAEGVLAPNVGMGSQFSENTYFTNKGFSAYHGLLVTLNKNTSYGLRFDVNYTWSHSIDNVSLIANKAASGGYGFICDALNPRACRGNSDFDVTHYVTGDFLYALPVGRGRTFAANAPHWLNQVIGGWDISGIPTWRTGSAITTNSNAYVAGYSNNAPAIFNGDYASISTKVHKSSTGAVSMFADKNAALAAFSGPVGFAIGSRNNLRGPRYFNLDMGLAKTFPVVSDKVNVKFRADAYNVLNHPNFDVPTTTALDITGGTFGQITKTVKTDGYGARVLQLALRLEF